MTQRIEIIAPKEILQTGNQSQAQTSFVTYNTGFTPNFSQQGPSGINFQTNQGSGIIDKLWTEQSSLDYRYVDQAKNPCQGQIILVPPSTNQSIIYYSPLQIIEQRTTTNSIQTVFVSQPPNVNQSATAPQAAIPPPQTAPAQSKSTLCRKSESRYLPPQKKISKFFCDFGECKLSFHSVEDLR